MAEYALEAVQALVAQGKFKMKVTRCQEAIIKAFGCSASEARAKLQDMTLLLTSESFAGTIEQRFGQKFDEYGFVAEDGAGWYLKLAIDIGVDGEEEVVALSCHPLERSILTKGGRIEP